MKILAINGGSSGSSWNIMINALKKCDKSNVLICTPNPKPNDIDYQYYQIKGSKNIYNRILTKFDGSDGFRNITATKKLIEQIRSFSPDIVHLHTLHGHFVNVQLLCNYLKNNNIKTVITLHDCWWFTGRCSNYTSSSCEQWGNACLKCINKRMYPSCLIIDRCSKYFNIKKQIFSGWNNVKIVAVSNWLKKEALRSAILKKSNVTAIYNGIDLSIYKTTELSKDDGKIKIICSAFQWSANKGIDLINDVANQLNDEYQISLIGRLPKNYQLSNKINYLGVISDKHKIAELYSSNNLFFNPSKEETFSLVNIEAQACGLPVICYPKTALFETTNNNACLHTKEYSVEAFLECIYSFKPSSNLQKECIAFASYFSIENLSSNYFDLYLTINNDSFSTKDN